MALSSVTRRRRSMLRTILNPETTFTAGTDDYDGPDPKTCGKKSPGAGVIVVKCSICYCEEVSQFLKEDCSSSLVVGPILKQFGHALDECEFTFCDFCQTQLESFVSLKKDTDKMSLRLSTMVIGLHALVSTSPPEEEVAAANCSVLPPDASMTMTTLSTSLSEYNLKQSACISSMAEDNGRVKREEMEIEAHRPILEESEVGPDPAVTAVLWSMDLMPMILNKVKQLCTNDSDLLPFHELRLICRDFNNAVLTMPHPPLILLPLNEVFPDPCNATACYPEPVSIEEVRNLNVTPGLCRKVFMNLSLTRDCDHHAIYASESTTFPGRMPIEAIAFLNFCEVYGNNIQIMQLMNVKEETMLPLTVQLDLHCPNLRDFSIDMVNCWCEQGANSREDQFLFSKNENLRKLTFQDGGDRLEDSPWRSDVCPVMYQMAKAIVYKAPNLEEFECNRNMFFDFCRHTKLKKLVHTSWPKAPSFAENELLNMLETSARSIATLNLDLSDWGDEDETPDPALSQTLKCFKFTPMPQLSKLIVSFLSGCNFNFGRALAECIFAPTTSRLQFLTIGSDDMGTIESFLLLLRDNFSKYRNETVNELKISGEGSGITDITLLPHLKTAFPNLKTLKFKEGGVGREEDAVSKGSDNLRDVFYTLSLWKQLKEVDFAISFPLQFSSLGSAFVALGKEFWKLGSIRKMRLHVENYASFFPNPRSRSNVDTKGDMKEGLMAMKSMKKVQFSNLVMPASVTQALLAFISDKGLPVSFAD